jgi:acyl-CoA reductase-like NAD-dependent aldehyde dehydrogenase
MVIDGRLAQMPERHPVINPGLGYGLGASVWTSNPERGKAIVAELETGAGWVNQHPDFGLDVPFGGAKHSGIGYENGRLGYNEFTRAQVINAKKK